MSAPHIHVNGHGVTRAEIHVPGNGPWFADVDFAEDAPGVTGSVEIAIGDLRMRGTVTTAGTFMLQRKARVVGGAGGWGKLLPALSYHNDAGVLARTVADDAAHVVGETIADFAGGVERLRADYVRNAGPAARALEDVAHGVPWWVDYGGITHVGERTSAPAAVGSYEVLHFDPRHGDVLMAVDDLTAIGIGSVLTERLDEPLTVRSLEIVITGESSRVTAWCPDTGGRTNQLADTLRAIVERIMDRRLFGSYRYRVVNMTADRVNLQAVSKVEGLPDLKAVSQWPGVAGAHAVLTPGTEVLVSFIAGNREDPIIMSYIDNPKVDGASVQINVAPVSLAFCGSEQAAARRGDLVQSGGPGTVVTLMPLTGVGAPPNNAIVAGVPCLISFSSVPPALPTGANAVPLFGVVATGSPKVKL